ncbi:MAG: flagellar motor protein MotB [Pseudomonadota bacterium]
MKKNQISDSLIDSDTELGWLVTYADLVTLLLVFFVMLFTMAGFEKNQYKAAMESIKVKVDSDASLVGLIELMEIPDSADTKISIEDITGLRSREKSVLKDINSLIKDKNQADTIATHILKGKIVVTIDGQTMFDSGSAALKTGAFPILDSMIDIAREYPEYTINIKGHTDDLPIATEKFPSNWELSAVRATTVLKYLINKGVAAQRLTATGYGDSDPLVPNISDRNRALNRRVEFVLEKKTTP